jgi:hypothetical protein
MIIHSVMAVGQGFVGQASLPGVLPLEKRKAGMPAPLAIPRSGRVLLAISSLIFRFVVYKSLPFIPLEEHK